MTINTKSDSLNTNEGGQCVAGSATSFDMKILLNVAGKQYL